MLAATSVVGWPLVIIAVGSLLVGLWYLYATRHNGDDHEPQRLDVQNHEGDR